ncbi:MAG TPA: hypothetical protein VKA67_13525, partial [Verrucomicrobiae bacterium]|nr:hypothetical protein [Verrucomicrobiae bacterium]
MLRSSVQMATIWFFVWGVVVLAVRISGVQHTEWLKLGVLGFVPLAIIAGARALARQPAFTKVRACYDRLKTCGGIVMSEETADMTAWQSQLPDASVPGLRWHKRQALLLLAISAVFTTVALLLPERLTRLAGHQPLEIGQVVEQLQTEVKTLQQEKIVEDKKAEDLQKQLAGIKHDSSGLDPNKTWEALDHIKESNSDAAKQAAQEALTKMTELAQAQTLAQAMKQAANSGMSADTATQAAQDLAGMLKSAKLDAGLLKAKIPPELLSGLNGLNQEQLDKLLRSLQFNKDALAKTVGKLANLKLIDAALLAKCKNAGQCMNPGALAAYLSSCTNGCDSLVNSLYQYGRGGLTRGDQPGISPMTWTDGASEKNVKFKAEALPPSTHLSDAELVGVSRAAPKLSDNNVAVEHDALAKTAGSGGSAYSQTVLPEHRQAVQNFFERE